MKRKFTSAGELLIVIGLSLFGAPSASAWDPSTTHQALLESAVTRSALHLRWMDASELERGLFSPLRIDPDQLDREQLRMLQLTVAQAHADVGIVPLGGPGACPSADAPAETQQFCVDRNLWEHSALGWLALGMVAEVTPSARHLHHFVDLAHPEAATWRDDELPATVVRARQARGNGEPIAGVVTGTNFSGEADSAIAWLEDPDDLLAPTQTYRHLALASHASTRAEREHHLALGLLGVGALLHVVQDLSVPAHARGDAMAFFSPLSAASGDRGLPLQEFVRVEYGREALPGVGTPSGTPTGIPLSETLLAHLLGNGSGAASGDAPEAGASVDLAEVGLVGLAGRHFFSESSVPAPKHLEVTLSPGAAATALLGADHHLDQFEIDGATLAPWPSDRGYLLSPTGRPLFAFDTDHEGRIRPYIDETCYRDQAALLLPAAVDATRSVLDLLWPAWPQMQRVGKVVRLEIPAWASAELSVVIESEDGDRRQIATQPLEVGTNNAITLTTGTLAAGERVVLILDAKRVEGPPIVIEQLLSNVETPVPEPLPIIPYPMTG
jgi:hypothetical protein